MASSLTELIEASLAQHSGTDSEHIYGVAATSERRRNTVNRLLEEAKSIISEEGIGALTFRKLSGRCKMAISNLQYYFPSSEDIIQALMRSIVTEYLTTLLNGSFMEVSDPERRLQTFLTVQMEDVQKKRTNAIFIAIWDLSQRDTFVAKWLGEIYFIERSIIMSMLAEIHPQQSQREIFEKAAIIAALIEGMMPLFGPSAQPDPAAHNVHDAALRLACHLAGIEAPATSSSRTSP